MQQHATQPIKMPISKRPTGTQIAMMIVRVWGSIPLPVGSTLEVGVGIAEVAEVAGALVELTAGVEELDEAVEGVEDIEVGVPKSEAKLAASEMTPARSRLLCVF